MGRGGGRGGGGGRPRVNPRDYDSYRETPSSSSTSAGQSSGGAKGGWFGWSANQGGDNADKGGLSAGPNDNGGNHWNREDGSSGRSVTRENPDGTFTNHVVDYDRPGSRGTAHDHTFTKDGQDVGSDTYRVK